VRLSQRPGSHAGGRQHALWLRYGRLDVHSRVKNQLLRTATDDYLKDACDDRSECDEVEQNEGSDSRPRECQDACNERDFFPAFQLHHNGAL